MRAIWRATKGKTEEEIEKNRRRKKAWYRANTERAKAQRKAWRDKNPDHSKEAGKRYRARNPEHYREKLRDYQITHAEELRAYRQRNATRRADALKKFYEANPGYRSINSATRRTKQLQATPPWADLDAIAAIYVAAKVVTDRTGVVHQVDHIIPLRNKRVCGLHIAANLQILTAKANRIKGNTFNP